MGYYIALTILILALIVVKDFYSLRNIKGWETTLHPKLGELISQLNDHSESPKEVLRKTRALYNSIDCYKGTQSGVVIIQVLTNASVNEFESICRIVEEKAIYKMNELEIDALITPVVNTIEANLIDIELGRKL